MTENTPGGTQPPDQPKRGSMRFQDAESTTPREPTLAEQRARKQALAAERDREITEQQTRAEAERKASTKRKVLIGSGVTVGLVGLVAAWYVAATPDEVTATCTTADGTVVDNDDYCDEGYASSHGGYHSGGFMFIPIPGGGYNQYHYNYGGTGAPGQKISGGSYTAPSNANVTTKSGKSVQRGGFGISNSSNGKSGGS
ncbi:hypothetical protein [Amycolatopsis magusensis]|uniref:Uncharacterized protein n=2 Tax=Amycolatopsis magusensis TaxID=882444 RepID=A0ABS4PJE8_9PSEU|nr:hypothetical protein [Amycolatopsis magusensis]MBP2179547.1 hypothetical protein [Amycolatopsis magusensis]MDI5977315.1 hypothetical protein [Amycolatopsis magusensis]